MLLSPGQSVFLKHGREWVTINAIDGDYLIIESEDGLDFHVHADDVLTSEEYTFEQIDKGNDVLEEKPEKKIPTEYGQFSFPDKEGVYLLLTSLENKPIVDEYRLWIINHTNYPCAFEGHLFSIDGTLHQEGSLLDREMQYMFCEIFKEDLSMQAKLDLNLKFTKDSDTIQQTVRYRFQPKKIIKMDRITDQDHFCRWIEVLDVSDIKKTPTAEKVQKTNSPKKRKKKSRQFSSIVNIHDVERKAAFPLSIDLHADKIFRNPGSMSKQEIITGQMDAFESYIREAYRLGIDKVFVIHGIGEGKLKSRIHDRLDSITGVTGYLNDYHPRYGWGATEVIL